MLTNLKSRFIKSKVTEQVETPEIEIKETAPRTSYLDKWRKLGRTLTGGEPTKDEVLKKLFPRGPWNFKTINLKTGVAMDSAIKPAMYTNDLPDEMVPFFTQSFIGWQACALLMQNPYIKKACEIPARDAVAVDYKLHYATPDTDNNPETDEHDEQNLVLKLKSISDKKMKIKDICRDANIFKKGYGQIIVVPTFSVDVDMSKPYRPSAVKKGTYTGMAIVQPFWIRYELGVDAVARPDKQGYYEPEYYTTNGQKKIHKSWVIKLVNGALPDILKPVYYWGGVPLTQQIYERVFCAEKVANEAPKLALTKRLLIIDGDINNLVANPQEAMSTMENVRRVRDNMGFMVKDRDDQVSQIDTSLTDFDALIMSQYQLTAAIAEMPVTKLMKTQLKGLANTGQYETKDYNQSLVEIQENDFNRILEFHYELLTLSELGRKIDFDIVWNPIDTPTEAELAQIESQQAATYAQYISTGVVDASEVRNILRQNEDSGFHNLPTELPEPDLDLTDLDTEQEIDNA